MQDTLAPCAKTGDTGTNAIGFAKTVGGRWTLETVGGRRALKSLTNRRCLCLHYNTPIDMFGV